jgi:CRP/FNR family transcriptional regulator, cyclic AMP receptor protein
VMEPGAVFGELSALLNQPHTADVRTLEASEFRVAQADLLVEESRRTLVRRDNPGTASQPRE